MKLIATIVLLCSCAFAQSTFGGYNGGGCGSSSTCTVTMNSNQTVQATFTLSTAIFNVGNQQPVTTEFYPNSLFTTPLPSTVSSHYLTNDQKIINCIFGGNCTNGTGGNEANNINAPTSTYNTAASSNGAEDGPNAYYSSVSDPIYKVVSITHPPVSSALNPLTTHPYFHLPNQAQWSNQNGGDQFLQVWDQSPDIDATPGGRILESYFSGSTLRALSNCTCTTTSCADTTPSCQLSFNYAEFDYPFSDTQPFLKSAGAYASAQYSPGVGMVRQLEVVQGIINHALILNTNCNASGFVFPAGSQVSVCTNGASFLPQNGQLFYIDSGYNCGTLPAWQKPFCVAMQTYGGYLTDTGGGPFGYGIKVSRLEAGTTAITGSAGSQLIPYLASQSGNGLSVSTDGITHATFPIFNMPGLVTGGHLHVIDPCVPKTMAGQAGGC